MKLLDRDIEGAPLDQEMADRDGPHPVDRHVGSRIRSRRKEMGVSQERLAEALGITFQQVQKYERGANRVSASKLWEIATALRTPVAYFYEGLNSTDGSAGERDAAEAFLMSSEGAELIASFPRIAESSVRRKLVDLVRAVAESN